MVSEWGEWSACFQPCAPDKGDNSQTDRCRWRHITQQPEGGGMPCPDKLTDHGECPLCSNITKYGGQQANKYEQPFDDTEYYSDAEIYQGQSKFRVKRESPPTIIPVDPPGCIKPCPGMTKI